MIITLKSKDCPDANGRVPVTRTDKWIITVPLESGDVLKLEVGREFRQLFKEMLEKEDADDAKEAEGRSNEGENK